MARTRWVLLVTFVALAGVLLAPRSKTSGPFVPSAADEVIETVPVRARGADAGVR